MKGFRFFIDQGDPTGCTGMPASGQPDSMVLIQKHPPYWHRHCSHL